MTGKTEYTNPDEWCDEHSRWKIFGICEQCRIKELETAVERYGRHLDDCPCRTVAAIDEGQIVSHSIDEECSCGLEQALGLTRLKE
jgi:hypothetical protein